MDLELKIYSAISGYTEYHSLPGKWLFFNWIRGTQSFVSLSQESSRFYIVNGRTFEVLDSVYVDERVNRPTVSPDGTHLAYSLNENNESFAVIYSLLGDSVYSITKMPETNIYSLCWVDDSEILVAIPNSILKMELNGEHNVLCDIDCPEYFINIEHIKDQDYLVETIEYDFTSYWTQVRGKLYKMDYDAGDLVDYKIM